MLWFVIIHYHLLGVGSKTQAGSRAGARCESTRLSSSDRLLSQAIIDGTHERRAGTPIAEGRRGTGIPARSQSHDARRPELSALLRGGLPLTRYLQVLAEHARGENLPPNHVPSTFLFAFAASRIVGRVSIRHELNEFLLRVGGHIGYAVVPEFRRQGYATAMLRLSLQIAHETLGIDRVLVTCDDDNVGSIRTIEKNGGVLENVISGPDLAKVETTVLDRAVRRAPGRLQSRRALLCLSSLSCMAQPLLDRRMLSRRLARHGELVASSARPHRHRTIMLTRPATLGHYFVPGRFGSGCRIVMPELN